MKKSFKLLSVVLVLCMMVGMLAGCGKTYAGGDTLVVGYSDFTSKFSPFFAKTGYDQDVADMVSVALIGIDREGNVVLDGIKGQKIPYNGKEYTYKGIADTKITINDDGTVFYDFNIKKGVKFSDGKELTADDAIFSMYAYSDPTYEGSSTFYALPIVGMEEYRSGMSSMGNLITAAGRDNTDFTYFTKEDADAYWVALDQAGVQFAQSIIDYCVASYADYKASFANNDVCLGMGLWGFGGMDDEGNFVTATTGTKFTCKDSDFPTAETYWKELEATYAGDYATLGSKEKATDDLQTMLDAILGENVSKYEKGIITSTDSVDYISGIEKTGEYSLRVTMSKYDAAAIYNVGVTVAPLHYYGSEDLYDYDKHMFGFEKGDLSSVKAKTTVPLGAGPYSFVSYENGVVTFVRNENYYKGAPKIKNLLFKESNDSDKLSGVVSGAFDITDPSLSQAVITSIKDYNSDGTLYGDTVFTNLVDNLGYGYIGLCASNIKVGDDPGSEASKNLRKGIATVLASYRDTVVNSYYGEMASVIQYPISNTSWAAPKPADEGYAIAYSKDVDGNTIYTDGMSEEDKYEAAKKACVGFLKAAGYTESNGKITAAPDGASLTYEIMIPGDGEGNHPSYGILTAAKESFAEIGITLEINDPANSADMWAKTESGTAEMWVAAWGATPDPDMYQVYYSTNVVGGGGTESNTYFIQDPQLDEMIIAARQSADQSYRKDTYKQCLQIILDWGVEIPVYQRQNCIIFSPQRVNMDTVTPDITTYWEWMNDIELLEMK